MEQEQREEKKQKGREEKEQKGEGEEQREEKGREQEGEEKEQKAKAKQSELVYYNAYHTIRFHSLLYWYISQGAVFPPECSRISSFYLKKSFQS